MHICQMQEEQNFKGIPGFSHYFCPICWENSFFFFNIKGKEFSISPHIVEALSEKPTDGELIYLQLRHLRDEKKRIEAEMEIGRSGIFWSDYVEEMIDHTPEGAYYCAHTDTYCPLPKTV